MLCLCEPDISASLSLHQYVDGGGPPEGSVVCLTVWLLGVEDPVLISCTVVISCGADSDSVWAWRTLVGQLLPMSWFIQMTATQTWGASCLLISTAVVDSSPAQPQARATSSAGSGAVMSHTLGWHSTSHCGRLHWRPWLPAQRQTVHFLFHSSYCLPHWLPAQCQWQCKRYLFSCTGYKPQWHISTCI